MDARRSSRTSQRRIAPSLGSSQAGRYLGGLIFLPALALAWALAKGLPVAWRWITAAIERWIDGF